jgi:hypothetical protein
MALLDALVAIVALGCVTGIVAMILDKFSGGRQRALQEELRLARQRIAILEQQNEHLERQVEWHDKLLALQDQHRVAEAEKPVALGDGHLVRPPDQVPTGERADEHQQA